MTTRRVDVRSRHSLGTETRKDRVHSFMFDQLDPLNCLWTRPVRQHHGCSTAWAHSPASGGFNPTLVLAPVQSSHLYLTSILSNHDAHSICRPSPFRSER